jgi:hypothetical protein
MADPITATIAFSLSLSGYHLSLSTNDENQKQARKDHSREDFY